MQVANWPLSVFSARLLLDGNKLLELFNGGRIHDSIMHRLEGELDQEELFAARVVEVMAGG
ncbi:hypothetical protein [Bradyrhizobium sp. CCBAU 53421]|uniref:hypothetical protein n=1 Tax=Bradyrhizobium sp. CCBAU 53421 TaxID=1325120 RepID=UPI00188D5AFD|nr:hypothetical protein [Bradyrhizobium sp. CCBAU 53421]